MWDSAEKLSAFGNVSIYIALCAALIAAFVGAAGTIASNRANDIISRQSNERIAKADASAAEANARAEEARARAEEAKAEAAKANERLQKSQELRRLSKAQVDALIPLLNSEHFKKRPAPRLQVASVNDSEAQMFAMDFLALFKANGIDIYPTPQGSLPNEIVQIEQSRQGLVLTVGTLEISADTQPFAHFERAMETIGWPISVELDDKLKADQAVLNVLRKPPIV